MCTSIGKWQKDTAKIEWVIRCVTDASCSDVNKTVAQVHSVMMRSENVHSHTVSTNDENCGKLILCHTDRVVHSERESDEFESIRNRAIPIWKYLHAHGFFISYLINKGAENIIIHTTNVWTHKEIGNVSRFIAVVP